jgi:hypothetical protein
MHKQRKEQQRGGGECTKKEKSDQGFKWSPFSNGDDCAVQGILEGIQITGLEWYIRGNPDHGLGVTS